MKSFIMINNDMLLDTNSLNTFAKVGTEGFSLYCYLLTQQGQSSYCQINIKMIINFFNREIRDPKLLSYTSENKSRVRTLKDKKTIKKYLNLLKQHELIYTDNEVEAQLNNILTIKVNKIKTNSFTRISEDLFVDYIHKIGHIGWSLLYILTKLHNGDFGSISSEGFANPSEEYLKSIIKKDVKTISVYLRLLESYRLIKIEEQEKIVIGIDCNKNEICEYQTNHYIVKNRLMENKYCIERECM